MAPWGPDAGDEKVMPEMNEFGYEVNLHMNFPFYGGTYNQTKVSSLTTLLKSLLYLIAGQMTAEYR